MLNDYLRIVANMQTGTWQEFGVEGVELVRMRIRPQRHAGDTPNHQKGVLKCADHVRTTKAIHLALEAGQPIWLVRSANGLFDDFKRLLIFHLNDSLLPCTRAAAYHKPGTLTSYLTL